VLVKTSAVSNEIRENNLKCTNRRVVQVEFIIGTILSDDSIPVIGHNLFLFQHNSSNNLSSNKIVIKTDYSFYG